jgi:regulator of cell morphogenesis and NO signaling
LTTTKTVRELAVEFPNATRIFEKLGIDYCCGGNKSLEEACTTANLSAGEVLESLALAEPVAAANQKDRNWQGEPVAALVDHIVGKHHRYTREEIARLGPLFDKICSVHGTNHPAFDGAGVLRGFHGQRSPGSRGGGCRRFRALLCATLSQYRLRFH